MSAETQVPLGHRRPVLYVLMGFLPPLVLLAVMGMAWVEDHLLPAAATPRHAPTLPVPERDTSTADPAAPVFRPGGDGNLPMGIAMLPALTAGVLLCVDSQAAGVPGQPAV
jgi:hypothetical protein